jgi:hypothetical protein
LALRLIGGDTAQANVVKGKVDCRPSKQNLTELHNRVKAPSVKEQNAATK